MICIFTVAITSHTIFMTKGTVLTENPLYIKNKYLKFNFKRGKECKIQYNNITLTVTQQP